MTARNVGDQWEKATAAHLQSAGLKLLQRNFSCRFGELDLIMRDGEVIVFVEVRFRAAATHGDGTLSVGKGKREKLARAAAVYLQQHPLHARMACRFDVVGCSGSLDHAAFDWTRNAFEVYE